MAPGPAVTVFLIFSIFLQIEPGLTNLEDPMWTPDPLLHYVARPAMVKKERLVERPMGDDSLSHKP